MRTPRLARPLAEMQLPRTGQAVLTARIDRLPAAEKVLLQALVDALDATRIPHIADLTHL